MIDNCCNHSLTNAKNDFSEPPIKSRVKRGYNGYIYYSSRMDIRLLSPQHWAQVRAKKRDTYCITYYDAIIMRWSKDKHQITAPLDDRKHHNVEAKRSITGIKKYRTSCLAFKKNLIH
jgi:hypothetical protein